jgi:hypothetical protein
VGQMRSFPGTTAILLTFWYMYASFSCRSSSVTALSGADFKKRLKSFGLVTSSFSSTTPCVSARQPRIYVYSQLTYSERIFSASHLLSLSM